MPEGLGRRTTIIVGARVLPFLAGWWFTTRYADWRQVVGDPLLLISSLPDALLVRYVVSPRSADWPIAMIGSLVLSSALFARWSLQKSSRRSGGRERMSGELRGGGASKELGGPDDEEAPPV